MKKKRRIKKILIPNRGEISIRIQRTCRELGIPTVAVFSDPDRNALHVRYADEAYPLPGAAPGETYLNQDLIFDIAKKSGADAIHPGYGFLSENSDFASRCQQEGIIFIGPSAEAIQLMGLKTQARKIMQSAGVPVVPGTGPLDDLELAAQRAEKMDYPVLVKASAGGGGKGMRKVDHPKELKSSFEACQREAKSAFGNPMVYLEKYLAQPRHIEFQVLADHHGNIIHLYERDCSIQRRHQKIIEETPSPIMDEELRRRMGAVAIEAARACGYTNAGTVEFLVDEDRNFYFLEMNTRLQVEHPITEMMTGMDLVEWQIRISQEEILPTDPVPRRGASMECRIYAEDPTRDFFPSPGLIKGISNPGGPGVRNDSGVYTGYKIPLEYDPLISKLVVWGADRSKALERMLRALEEYHLLGVRSNIIYLRKILQHPGFISGNYNTHFILQHQDSLLEKKKQKSDQTESIALVAAAVLNMLNNENQFSADPAPPQPKMSNWKILSRMNQSGSMV